LISWIDIVSPQLRSVHQEWIKLRRAWIMPSVGDYNAFATAMSEGISERSALILVPQNGRKPTFKYVGSEARMFLQDCAEGVSLSHISSALRRQAITSPLLRVCESRQPECRRLVRLANPQGISPELLLLPFGDHDRKVCVVHMIYECRGPDRKTQE
jgi:hypothetical protein